MDDAERTCDDIDRILFENLKSFFCALANDIHHCLPLFGGNLHHLVSLIAQPSTGNKKVLRS